MAHLDSPDALSSAGIYSKTKAVGGTNRRRRQMDVIWS